MVVGAFPAVKLGALLLKQVSKPIANAIKSRAKSSPFFRTYICMPPAQFYNWCEVQAKMWILNLGKPVNIPVLNEAMAIELGANLLGEGIIFVVAAAALIAEYSRSSAKETAKEAAKAEEMARLNSTIMDLYLYSEQQATEIRELKRMVYDLDTRVVQKPWVPKKEPSLPEPDSKSPPKKPPPQGPILSLKSEDDGSIAPDVALVSNNTQQQGLVLCAIQELEEDIFKFGERERVDGVVTLALNHFYRNVFKVSLTV